MSKKKLLSSIWQSGGKLFSFLQGRYRKLGGKQKTITIVMTPIVVTCCCLLAYTAATGESQVTKTPLVLSENRSGSVAELVTSTVKATETAVPTRTLEPTETPLPADTAVPTSTQTPLPTPTPIPTATPLPTNTAVPTPQPTQPPPPSSGDIKISYIYYNGENGSNEPDEYAVIMNTGIGTINLNGWKLNAGNPGQDFYFPNIDLGPGRACRVYTNEIHPESCGGASFGSGNAIWLNKGDCGYLFDNTGVEISRYCY